MPNPAAGLFKQLAYKAEATYGTAAGASGAQLLRRVQSTLDLAKDTYQSNEIRPDLQVADFRHGVRRVRGKIGGELSAKTYSDFFAAALKRDFATVSAMTGLGITIAAGVGSTYTVTRSSGDFLAAGLKAGMVARLTAGSFNAANLNKNLFVVGVTATVATVLVLNGSALVAEGPIASATVTLPGKATYVPTSGHTDKSFTVEHFYSDLVQSEQFLGCKVDQIALALPPTGMATIDIDVMGQDVATGGSQYFTSPTAITTTGVMAAVNGVLRLGGSTVATVTGLSLTIDPNFSGDPVVGSNKVPFLFPGTVRASGQMTAYFDSVALRDAFINETEIDMLAAFTADNSAASDFLAFACPRIKVGGATKNDGQGGLVQTLPFTALLNSAGGAGVATEKTTIQMQDSAA
ncbi:MAG: phage tail tube protein [Rubrivivax sp.]